MMIMAIFTTSREALFLVFHPSLWFRKPIDISALPDSPLELFDMWYRDATKKIHGEFPNAMCLSTLSPDGYPEGRIVLLKSWNKKDFIFYTNHNSAKGRSLEETPKASLTFYWEALQRQVRITGDVRKVSDKLSDDYFAKRPRRSQLGAWASAQSSPLQSRKELLNTLAEYEAKFSAQPIPRPPFWGGYELTPIRFEFWELRLNRLHDRVQYKQSEGANWEKIRLSP